MMDADLRFSPTRAKRKLAALEAIKRHFSARARRPSYSEIGAAIGVSRERALQLVRQLIRDGDLRRIDGGWEIVWEADEAVRALTSRGWRVNPAGAELVPPFTISTLPAPIRLAHIPDIDWGGDADDGRAAGGDAS